MSTGGYRSALLYRIRNCTLWANVTVAKQRPTQRLHQQQSPSCFPHLEREFSSGTWETCRRHSRKQTRGQNPINLTLKLKGH